MPVFLQCPQYWWEFVMMTELAIFLLSGQSSWITVKTVHYMFHSNSSSLYTEYNNI